MVECLPKKGPEISYLTSPMMSDCSIDGVGPYPRSPLGKGAAGETAGPRVHGPSRGLAVQLLAIVALAVVQ